jgi:hypothetical protein
MASDTPHSMNRGSGAFRCGKHARQYTKQTQGSCCTESSQTKRSSYVYVCKSIFWAQAIAKRVTAPRYVDRDCALPLRVRDVTIAHVTSTSPTFHLQLPALITSPPNPRFLPTHRFQQPIEVAKSPVWVSSTCTSSSKSMRPLQSRRVRSRTSLVAKSL